MAIVTLRLVDVKGTKEGRPVGCRYCGSGVLQRWGGVARTVKDTRLTEVLIYRYRCAECGRTFRDYPEGITSAHQSQRLVQLAALSWVLGLSLRATSAILSAFPVALSHTSIWKDVQVLAIPLKRPSARQVCVLGVDGFYPKVKGEEQPTVVAVDLGNGQPIALAAISEKDWRAVNQWLQPLIAEFGVQVIVTDDLKEYGMLAERLKVQHQVCHFHLLRWVWNALEAFRKHLDADQHMLLDEVWQIVKERPAGGAKRLFALWQAIPVRRTQDKKTSALYRLRLLILRLHDNWGKYTLDQQLSGVPSTNNGTERAIGKWRIRSFSTRGFKSWAGLESAFLACARAPF